MDLYRRRFLSLAGSAAALLPIGRYGWAFAADAPVARRLVVVMLRGAVDGLSIVAPCADPLYRQARPNIALGAPGEAGGAIDLDGHFGLHPALGALMPLWRERRLAFVHAAGSADPSRSHFDAQDFMESGTPGIRATPDGWMNRLIAALPPPHDPMGALSMGATRPRILAGPNPTANFPPGAENPTPLDRPALGDAFAKLYAGNDPLGTAFRQARSARQELLADLAAEQAAADNGAPPPKGFPAVAIRLGRLLARDGRIRLAFVDLGGWDTHVEQGNAAGQLANHLQPLGEGLAGLAQALGPQLADTVILVMSEFGRTVRENGNRGTDHGHGNVMWVMGGRVAGGRVHGNWPGLAPDGLFEGRDLAVTTDFRSVIAATLERHLGLADRQLAAVLPKAPVPAPAGLFVS